MKQLCVGFVGGVASLFILRRIANTALPNLAHCSFLAEMFVLAVSPKRLPIVESRERISLLRSHGTVLESLPSHGSSCLITNVINYIRDVPIASDEKVADAPCTFS